MTDLYLGADIETTGLEPGDHRIIEVFLGLWNPAGQRVFAFEQRIDPQRNIPIDSTRIHGITMQDLVGKPTWEAVAPKLLPIFNKARIRVAHNGDDFDFPFLTYEFKRVGLVLPPAPSIDTMLGAPWATPDGKRPRLEELAFACEVPYDREKAHAASYDVEVMMECFFKARGWGYFQDADGISEAA